MEKNLSRRGFIGLGALGAAAAASLAALRAASSRKTGRRGLRAREHIRRRWRDDHPQYRQPGVLPSERGRGGLHRRPHRGRGRRRDRLLRRCRLRSGHVGRGSRRIRERERPVSGAFGERERPSPPPARRSPAFGDRAHAEADIVLNARDFIERRPHDRPLPLRPLRLGALVRALGRGAGLGMDAVGDAAAPSRPKRVTPSSAALPPGARACASRRASPRSWRRSSALPRARAPISATTRRRCSWPSRTGR